MKSRLFSFLPVGTKFQNLHLWSAAIALSASSLFLPSMGAANAQANLTLASSSGITTLEGKSVSGITCSASKETPNHTIDITEDSDRRFKIQGSGNLTLLIVNSQNKRFCVQTDEFSGGEAELPGRWKKGSYRVYVGGQSATVPYKLSILPIN